MYLFKDNVNYRRLPRFRSFKFVLIISRQVDEMKKAGVEYYSFSDFGIAKNSVEVTFGRQYINIFAGYANSYRIPYSYRKIAGKWQVQAGEPAISVTESH